MRRNDHTRSVSMLSKVTIPSIPRKESTNDSGCLMVDTALRMIGCPQNKEKVMGR
jgi:hypothetical protein